MTIKPKLIITTLILTVVPVIVVGLMVFSIAKESLQKTTINMLTVIADFQESQIYHFIDQSGHIVKDFSSDGFIRKSLHTLQLKKSKNQDIHNDLINHLKKNKLPLHNEIIMIDLLGKNGKIISSTVPERIGVDKSKTKYFNRSLHESITRIVEEPMPHDSSFEISMPVYDIDNSKHSLGVIVCHFNKNILNKILSNEKTLRLGARTQFENIGETGESYLVNSDSLMITDSIFKKNASYKQKVNTYPVKMGLLHNKEVSGLWLDYRDVPVVGASMIIEVGNIKWVLISEQDKKEALQPIAYLKKSFILIMLLSLITSSIIIAYLSAGIARPIQKLKYSVDQIIKGNLNTPVKNINSKDEIGFLAEAFNIMIEKLHTALTQLKKSNHELKELATHDDLTTLYNHRYLNESMQYEIERAQRYQKELSCIMIDIDFFKHVNDHYGHLFGDFVLHEIAMLIKKHSRVTDIVGRYGGEEFLIILPDTTLVAARIAAEKLCVEVQQHEFSKDGIICNITISLGVTEYSKLIKDANQLLQQADDALYTAKEHNRNCVKVYQPVIL